MEQQQLEKLKIWFYDYVASFYGDDEYINANLKLKEDHTRRICEEMRYLTNELGLNDNQKRIAEVIALFHDVGRFKQFVKYRTYNDSRSINHCLLGQGILQETKVLDTINKEERQIIQKAIEYHGLRELPAGLDGQCLLFSQLIRDVDKLDIFYLVTDFYKEFLKDPRKFNLELEMPDTPEYSRQIVEQILQEQRIDYKSMRTWNDMKLLQLAWVYDINFMPTLKRIRQRRYLESILEFLPHASDIEKVRKKIFEYVDSRIEQNK